MENHSEVIYERLTWREQEILHLLGEKLSNDEIAARLSFSVNSVKWYNQQIFSKLGVNNRREAAARAKDLDLEYARSETQLIEGLQEPMETKPRNNLPRRLTSFIGREREKEQIKALLAKAALVTLTGSGGTGKTRLAIEVAGELLESFPDGIWFVELARLDDPTNVARAVFTAAGLQENVSFSQLDQLRDYLSDKQKLLVFDNCEHLIEPCAQLIERLLCDSRNVKIIATSREVLGLSGEMIYRVPSLSTPDPRELPARKELAQFEALRLFAERAASIQPGFTLTPDNAATVAQICQRVDGIPLAIELAAARAAILSVEQIAARLNDRFRLLTGGNRSALPRQQTLRASIDWSYSMLNELERLLLTRLAIFSGGWTLEDAESVCGFGGLESGQILDILDSLAKKSMVVAQIETNPHPSGQSRYRLLETIRQYSLEKLVDQGGGSELRQRHLAAFLRLAEQADPELRGPHQRQWNARLEVELDNMRSALEWALEDPTSGSREAGLRLITQLAFFMNNNGFAKEGLEWLDKFLANFSESRPLSPYLKARANLSAGSFFLMLGRFSEARHDFETSVHLFRTLGDQKELIRALSGLTSSSEWSPQVDTPSPLEIAEEGLMLARQEGYEWEQALMLTCKGTCLDRSDLATAQICFEESIELFEKIGDRRTSINTIIELGLIAIRRADYDLARLRLAKAVSIAREYKSKADLMWSLAILGDMAHLERQYPLMESYFQECLRASQEIGNQFCYVFSLHHIGVAARRQGQLVRAEEFIRQSLYFAKEYHCLFLFPEILIGMAGIALDSRRLEQSARLLAVAITNLDTETTCLGPITSEEYRQDLPVLRGQLEQAKYEAAWAEGQGMTMEHALKYAFEKD